MKYQANPVIGDAFKIVHVADKANADYSANLTLDDEGGYIATSAMLERMVPVVGDYLVRQEDGYEYLNPAAVFERKYSPLETPPSPENQHILEKYHDAVDDAGPGASQQKINERCGVLPAISCSFSNMPICLSIFSK